MRTQKERIDKKGMLSFFLITALILLFSTSLSAGQREEILIGTHLPLSGPNAAIGVDQKWAYDMAVADVNKNGGIYVKKYGKKLPVRLVTIDDETDPGKAAAAVERLAKQKKVDMILSGHAAAYGVIPGSVAAEKHKIYYHGTACFIPPWQEHNFQWSTLFFFDLDDLASVPFKVWNSLPPNERPKRPGLIMEDNFDGRAIRTFLRKQAKNYGYKLIFDMPWTPGGKDYTAQILKAKNRKVDALLIFGGTGDLITLIRQMQQQRYSVKYLQAWKGAWNAEFWQGLGSQAEYIISDGHWSENYPFTGAKQLGKRYYKKFHKKSVSVGTFYALAQSLWQAIEKAGTLDSKKVRQAVLNNTFDTVMGEVDYNNSGVAIYPAPAFQWNKGDQQVVFPFDYSNYEVKIAPPWNKRY